MKSISKVNSMKTAIIIPVKNQSNSLLKTIEEVPNMYLKDALIAISPSKDKSYEIAKKTGLTVIKTREGYGASCLQAIQYLKRNIKPEIVVFLNANYTDDPKDVHKFVKKIEQGYDFVLGIRRKNGYWHQRLGNKIFVKMIKALHGYAYKDICPYRAIKFEKLLALNMEDESYGWTCEMQIKAVKAKLKIAEIEIHERERVNRRYLAR